MKQISITKHRLLCFRRALLIALIVVGIVACETSPPVQEMSDARQAIMVAKDAGAEELAQVHLDAARRYLASAEQSLAARAYHQARRDARHAKMKALDALKASEASRKD